MAVKKKAGSGNLTSELRKYNEDLDKHMPSLDIDVTREPEVFNRNPKDSAEYLTLFSQSMLDLRTEVALMRKNLSADVEGMVMRVVTDQQNKFEARMNDFFVKSVLETKENWERHVTEFADQMAGMKRIVHDLTLQNDQISSSLKDITEDMTLIKSQVATVDQRSQDKTHHQKLDTVHDSIKKLSEQIKANQKVEKTLMKVSEYFSHVLQRKDEMQRIIQVENQKESANEVDFVEQRVPSQNDVIPQKTRRLLEIDKKLSKLEQLR